VFLKSGCGASEKNFANGKLFITYSDVGLLSLRKVTEKYRTHTTRIHHQRRQRERERVPVAQVLVNLGAEVEGVEVLRRLAGIAHIAGEVQRLRQSVHLFQQLQSQLLRAVSIRYN
jgi:predicted component of type VI protein secretion system